MELIAHFHYVLVGAIVFNIFAGIYYWYPKVTGRMLSETLGKWHFWLFLIGFHITFDTMHFVGFLGMPRSIYTYEPDRGWPHRRPGHAERPAEASGQPAAVAHQLALGYLVHLAPSVEFSAVVFSRTKGGERSLGCVDAGVVDAVAATGL